MQLTALDQNLIVKAGLRFNGVDLCRLKFLIFLIEFFITVFYCTFKDKQFL